MATKNIFVNWNKTQLSELQAQIDKANELKKTFDLAIRNIGRQLGFQDNEAITILAEEQTKANKEITESIALFQDAIDNGGYTATIDTTAMDEVLERIKLFNANSSKQLQEIINKANEAAAEQTYYQNRIRN